MFPDRKAGINFDSFEDFTHISNPVDSDFERTSASDHTTIKRQPATYYAASI
jgi:hypothetical protein